MSLIFSTRINKLYRNGERFSLKIKFLLQVPEYYEEYSLKFYSSKARASHAMVSIDHISKLYLSGGIDSNQTFKKLFLFTS